MTLDETVFDYYQIVPPGVVPVPKAEIPFLSTLGRMAAIAFPPQKPHLEPTPQAYPDPLRIQLPEIPSTYELRNNHRPCEYLLDLIEAVLPRIRSEPEQERTYYFLMSGSSFGNFFTSLTHVDFDLTNNPQLMLKIQYSPRPSFTVP